LLRRQEEDGGEQDNFNIGKWWRGAKVRKGYYKNWSLYDIIVVVKSN